MVEYKQGDLLTSGCDIICHQCNCMGVMGSGIAKQIRDKYAGLYKNYEVFVNDITNAYGREALLGRVYYYPTANGPLVANMFSQFNYLPRNVVHTDYAAFRKCIRDVGRTAKSIPENYNIKLPDVRIGFPYKIGCGLAGGDWNIVKQILEDEFSSSEYKVEIWKLV